MTHTSNARSPDQGRLEKPETGIRNRNGNRNRNRDRKRNRNRNGKRNLYKNRDNIYLNLSSFGFNSYSAEVNAKYKGKKGTGTWIGRGMETVYLWKEKDIINMILIKSQRNNKTNKKTLLKCESKQYNFSLSLACDALRFRVKHNS